MINQCRFLTELCPKGFRLIHSDVPINVRDMSRMSVCGHTGLIDSDTITMTISRHNYIRVYEVHFSVTLFTVFFHLIATVYLLRVHICIYGFSNFTRGFLVYKRGKILSEYL